MNVNVAKLFEQQYPVGAQVIVINDEDVVVRGEIVEVDADAGFKVRAFMRKPIQIGWQDLRFIANDGYPVRQVKAPFRQNSEEELETLRLQLHAEHSQRSVEAFAAKRTGHTAFGDPFELEADLIVPAHLGNSGLDPENGWEAEVLICTARDGAVALLWDLETVYEIAL